MLNAPKQLPDVSFVIPAHNEQHEIGGCLRAIRNSALAVRCDHEIIVVNDASTDATAEIASELADLVVDVELRNIGAVRNAGAAVATKSLLVFVDADTRLPAGTLHQILVSTRLGIAEAAAQGNTARASGNLGGGVLGGGATVRFDQKLDPMRHVMAHAFVILWQDVFRYAAGCLVFVRRDVFEKIGGFNEEYFAAEEMYLSREIKRRGKFRIVRNPVVTSARKMRTYGYWELIGIVFSALLSGPWSWKSKSGLGVLYDARREEASPRQPE